MKKVVLGLFTIACILSCNSQNNSTINKEYEIAKEIFPSKFLTHFPKKLGSNNITFLESLTPEAGLLRLDVINRLDAKQMNIINNAIVSYNAADSCLLVANRFANLSNYSYNIELTDIDKKIINLDCYESKLPIPNFWHHDYTTNETECKLSPDFDLYVLDAKPGQFLKEELLTDGKFMPSNWKNGYSRGVAISEEKNVIIYWLLIW